MHRVQVLDLRGEKLSPCAEDKARRLVAEGRATWVGDDRRAIRLPYAVELPQPPEEDPPPGLGKRILVHVCCAPCATYTVARLREEGWDTVAHWFNPNIHPYSEHERRRDALVSFADQVNLLVVWEQGYEMPGFLREVVGSERFGQRCRICYRLRLERTAQVAAERHLDAFTTTLLISPYQDQEAIRSIGEGLAEAFGVAFYFENFRRGFSAHHRMAKEYGLYRQRYCGCIYSEWEAQDRCASTHPRG